MEIDILTLFPAMFNAVFQESIIGRAQQKGLIKINIINIRDFANNKHMQVDDYPYGGGAGMLMKADVVARAIKNSAPEKARTIYLSPQGRQLNQKTAFRLAQENKIILLCGHYEGIDERALQLVDEEISIGDYVLTGGELAAMVLVDAVARLVPGVLGDSHSPVEESFTEGLLEYPQYTRPFDFDNDKVPEVLISGHHEKIRRWRKKQSLLRTFLKRPELLLAKNFDAEEKELLLEILFDREY